MLIPNVSCVYRSVFLLYLFIVLLIILVPNTVSSSHENKEEERRERLETLQLVQIFHRHGERNPLQSLGPLYPDDEDQFPEGWGQLTKNGARQMLELGQVLRQRYDGFLHKEYKSDETFILSSDLDRTIQSVLSLAQGLYPFMDKENPTPQLVPIRTIDADVDHFLHFSKDCPKFKHLIRQVMSESKSMKELAANHAHLLDDLNQATGRSAKSFFELIYFIDYLQVLAHQKKPLPEWMTQEMSTVFKSFVRNTVQMSMGHQVIKRLRSPTMQKVVESMQLKIRGEIRKKMFIYSCHDLTLLAILSLLGFEDVDSMPPYASSIIFELHEKPHLKKYNVELYFRNKTGHAQGDQEEEPLRLEIPGCGSPCFLNRLEEILKTYFVEDMEKECQVEDQTGAFSKGHPSLKGDEPDVLLSKSNPSQEDAESCQASNKGECDSNS